MPQKLVVNCKTGKQTMVELTQKELNQREIDRVASEAQEAKEKIKRDADQLVQAQSTLDAAKKLLAEGKITQERVDRYQAKLEELKNGQ